MLAKSYGILQKAMQNKTILPSCLTLKQWLTASSKSTFTFVLEIQVDQWFIVKNYFPPRFWETRGIDVPLKQNVLFFSKDFAVDNWDSDINYLFKILNPTIQYLINQNNLSIVYQYKDSNGKMRYQMKGFANGKVIQLITHPEDSQKIKQFYLMSQEDLWIFFLNFTCICFKKKR